MINIDLITLAVWNTQKDKEPPMAPDGQDRLSFTLEELRDALYLAAKQQQRRDRNLCDRVAHRHYMTPSSWSGARDCVNAIDAEIEQVEIGSPFFKEIE